MTKKQHKRIILMVHTTCVLCYKSSAAICLVLMPCCLQVLKTNKPSCCSLKKSWLTLSQILYVSAFNIHCAFRQIASCLKSVKSNVISYLMITYNFKADMLCLKVTFDIWFDNYRRGRAWNNCLNFNFFTKSLYGFRRLRMHYDTFIVLFCNLSHNN